MEVALLIDVEATQPLVLRLLDQVDRHRRLPALEDDAVVGQMCLVGLTTVVEPRCDVDLERHLAPHTPEHADQPVRRRGDPAAGDRHEVDELPHPRLGHETGDQDRGVREVQLLAAEDLHGRPHPEMTTALVVEQGTENAGRVEPRRAEPVDRPVGGDKCRGLEIADEAVVGNERVVIHGSGVLFPES